MDIEIRVKGHLSDNWSDWFSGLIITNLDTGEAVLSGQLADQAALYAVLNRIHALNLKLVSMSTSADTPSDVPFDEENHPTK